MNARSDFLSPLKSPTTGTSAKKASAMEMVGARNPPSPIPRVTAIIEVGQGWGLHGVNRTRSSLPSPLKSPVAVGPFDLPMGNRRRFGKPLATSEVDVSKQHKRMKKERFEKLERMTTLL